MGEIPSTFMPERSCFAAKSGALEKSQRRTGDKRVGGGEGGSESGMKSKRYLCHGGANMPCDENHE